MCVYVQGMLISLASYFLCVGECERSCSGSVGHSTERLHRCCIIGKCDFFFIHEEHDFQIMKA